MKVSYKERPGKSPWPRVMRYVGQLTQRSVHRGKTGPCIGLRENDEQLLLVQTPSRSDKSHGLFDVQEAVLLPPAMLNRHDPREDPYAVILHVRICAGCGQ